MPLRITTFLRLGCALATVAFLLSRPALGAGEDLFEDCVIPELRLEISRDGINALKRNPRKYVSATLHEGKRIYTNVAVHLKGGPGSYRPLEDRPAFTLNFDRLAPGQTFHGLKKIHLNNSVQDHSYLNEKISRELMNAAGVPAPRAGHAWLEFNDRELGMYVLLEGVNKQFLKRYFKDVKGNVYDGHSGSDVNQNMPTNSGENRKDKTRLHDLGRAALEPDLAKRQEAIENTLDVDRFLAFVAMEMILGHWDGYTANRNNFRVYHDRDSDRMVFLPHGMDQVLARRFPTIPQNSAGMVVRSVLEIPDFRKRYRERFAQLSTNVFVVNSITNRLQEVASKIEAVLAKNDPGAVPRHQQAASTISRRVVARARTFQNQLTSPVLFNGLGVARLTNWSSKLDLGKADLNRERDENGNPLLHIATDSGCTASWRNVSELPPGEYRFQARIKTHGVVLPSEERSGAGLRISGHRVGQKNSGDLDWTSISFDFVVPPDRPETELVCELRAERGEIWYDLKSLKLIRK